MTVRIFKDSKRSSLKAGYLQESLNQCTPATAGLVSLKVMDIVTFGNQLLHQAQVLQRGDQAKATYRLGGLSWQHPEDWISAADYYLRLPHCASRLVIIAQPQTATEGTVCLSQTALQQVFKEWFTPAQTQAWLPEITTILAHASIDEDLQIPSLI